MATVPRAPVFGELLRPHRSRLLDRWRGAALAAYPEETRRFLVREKDRFQNPVGAILGSSLEGLLDGLLEGVPEGELAARAEDLMRVRAVQDLGTAGAVGFVFALREAAREALAQEEDAGAKEAELRELDRRLDRLALVLFDRYLACREEVAAIRVREDRRRVAVALKRLERLEAERCGGASTGGEV